jgi:D-glycero-D-manno-heptose 1,7-bisphosphate phosphatase
MLVTVRAAVFLDRDNTLIANDGDLGDPNQVRLLDGVAGGIRALRDAGFRIVVITNQGGVARGVFTEDDVQAVNEQLSRLVDEQAGAGGLIDRVYYCPYHPEGVISAYRREHPWRKPHSGMLLQAAHDLQLDLARSWMIGDQPRDIRAGQSAGCRTVLLGQLGDEPPDLRPTACAGCFLDAVGIVLDRVDDADRPAPATAAPPPAASSGTDPATGNPLEPLRRAVTDLADELRSARQRRAEFTALKMAASVCQLLALALLVPGLLQLRDTDAYLRWMAGAAFMQLLTITFLLVEQRA